MAFKPEVDENAIQRELELLERMTNQQDDPPGTHGLETKITPETNGWLLSPVNINGENYQYHLLNGLLDNKAEKPLYQWIQYSTEAFPKGQHVACAGDELLAILNLLYPNLKHPTHGTTATQAWNFLAQALQKQAGSQNRPCLLNEITYSTQPGIDTITHSTGLPHARTLHGKLHGPNGQLNQLTDGNEYTRLTLGHNNATHACTLLHALIGLNPKAYRINQQPTTPTKSALVVGVGYVVGIFGVDAGYLGGNDRPALGVARRAKISSGNEG